MRALTALPLLLESAIAAFAILGGFMAAASGFLASQASWSEQPAATISAEVNRGLALGFDWGALGALMALMIVMSQR
ncbi:MAG: hypothetical protein QOJ38_1691 [Solirubrobacterales bacterium]|jgi:hypothetical protein|nr:hypothetical protein [Solirubrobacterales bacterium]